MGRDILVIGPKSTWCLCQLGLEHRLCSPQYMSSAPESTFEMPSAPQSLQSHTELDPITFTTSDCPSHLYSTLSRPRRNACLFPLPRRCARPRGERSPSQAEGRLLRQRARRNRDAVGSVRFIRSPVKASEGSYDRVGCCHPRRNRRSLPRIPSTVNSPPGWHRPPQTYLFSNRTLANVQIRAKEEVVFFIRHY